MPTALRGRRVDALLLLMTIIWGTNFPVVKTAFREVDPQAFAAMRLIIASVAFLAVIAAVRLVAGRSRRAPTAPAGDLMAIFHTPAPITAREWVVLAALGGVGHALYQFCFIGGLARTTV